MGRTRVRVRTQRTARIRMKEWSGHHLSLSLSHSLVRLRAFKLDRVQVRPMADVAKLPCDSGFTLSRASSVAITVSLSSSLPSETEVRTRKNGETGRCVARVFNSSSHEEMNKLETAKKSWNSKILRQLRNTYARAHNSVTICHSSAME